MKNNIYDTKTYNFRDYVEKFLDFPQLENIHKDFPFGEILISGTDQNRHLHRKFYNGMDNSAEFVKLYRKFVKEIMKMLSFKSFPHLESINRTTLRSSPFIKIKNTITMKMK